jgi:hypothetical protein
MITLNILGSCKNSSFGNETPTAPIVPPITMRKLGRERRPTICPPSSKNPPIIELKPNIANIIKNISICKITSTYLYVNQLIVSFEIKSF